MVVGGSPAYNKAEFVDLSGDSKVCSDVPDFPLDRGSVGTYFNNKAQVCGGRTPANDSNKCFTYEVKDDKSEIKLKQMFLYHFVMHILIFFTE